jgi:Bacterial Ig-like domain
VLTDGSGTTVATLFEDSGSNSSGNYNSPWRYWEYTFTDLPGEGQFRIEAKQSSQMWSMAPDGWSWEPNVLGLDDVKTSTVSVAPSPPKITSPQNNTYDKDGSFSVSGSAERGSTVELFEGTTSKGTTKAEYTKADSSSGAWSIPLSGVSDGAHTYSAKAANAAGTSNASSPVSITVDTVKPSAPTLDSPADNSYDTDGNIHFDGHTEGGSTVKIYQDGATTAAGSQTTDSTFSTPWWNIYLTGVSEQSTAHTFDVTATDAAGNESAKRTVHVTVDDSPPTITSPQNNTHDLDGSFKVSGSAEAGSTVELFEDTTSREFEGGVLVHTLSSTVESRGTTKADSSSGAWSIALSGVSEGPHTYFAKATGAGGNTSSASNSVTVTVEKAAPTVSDVYPADGATGAGRNTDIAASFSEPMDPATFTTSTVTLVKEGTTTPISARVGYYESNGYYKVWLSPPYEQGFYLDAKTKYTVKIKGGTNGVKDLAGKPLANGNQASGDYWWTFTTGDAPGVYDTIAPKVYSVFPKDGDTGVDPTTDVTATFTKDMLASSINGQTFKLFRKGSTTKLAATVSYPDLNSPSYTAKLDPRDSLRSGVTYKAVVITGAKDLAGNSLAQQKAWFFKVR